MYIFPAIDLYEGKAVRLLRGDYAQMTVYSENPPELAEDFVRAGVSHIHLVDLEGAKSGTTPNFETVRANKKTNGVFCEIGGGVLTAAVGKNNVYGCQFHPEKSGRVGLDILRAFCEDV